jgi:hypothetical protein
MGMLDDGVVDTTDFDRILARSDMKPGYNT